MLDEELGEKYWDAGQAFFAVEKEGMTHPEFLDRLHRWRAFERAWAKRGWPVYAPEVFKSTLGARRHITYSVQDPETQEIRLYAEEYCDRYIDGFTRDSLTA